MSRGPDAATLLERAILAGAARAGIDARVTDAIATRWASATFAGARHVMTLAGSRSAAADDWLACLAEAELPMRGHLVADLQLTRIARTDAGFTATIEVLTVEER